MVPIIVICTIFASVVVLVVLLKLIKDIYMNYKYGRFVVDDLDEFLQSSSEVV